MSEKTQHDTVEQTNTNLQKKKKEDEMTLTVFV